VQKFFIFFRRGGGSPFFAQKFFTVKKISMPSADENRVFEDVSNSRTPLEIVFSSAEDVDIFLTVKNFCVKNGDPPLP
jgi:regulatory protein YycH of two-component signal transduction system YycFG